MSTATTQINITAKDSTAGAFASAERGLSGLASSALKTTAGLAGIGLSIAGAVDAVKGIAQATIQFQQFTNTLQVGMGSAKGAAEALTFVRAESQRLGLDLASSADQFAKLTAASKGTALEGKATGDIFSSISEAATAMGLSADQTAGSLLAIQQMISKGTVSAEELRGQLGERLPGAFQIAARAIGVTTAELDKMLRTGQVTAEQLLPALSAELNKTFGAQAEQSAKGLTAQMNRMNTAFFDLKIAIGESGLINFLSSGIELATKLTNTLTKGFGGGPKLSPVDAQVSQIKAIKAEMESMKNLTHVPLIGGLLFDKKEFDLLQHRLETATDDLKALEAAASKASNATGDLTPAIDPKLNELMEEGKKIAEKYADPFKALQELQKKYKELLDAGAISQDVYNRALKAANDQYAKPGIKQRNDELNKLNKAQSDALRIESEYVKLLQIEKKQREDLIAPYRESAKQANTNLVQMQDQIAALQLVKDRQITLKEAVELTTIARLNERKASSKDPQVISQINAEIEARKKIADLIPLHAKLEQQTRRTTDQVSQLWIQAGRNIQSQLANSIFNFFDDGLKGMVKNVTSAVGRIASEFASLRIAQAIGLSSMFGVSGTASAGGIGSTGSGFLDVASLGLNASSLFKSGFGATNLIGGLGSNLPGTAGSFFSGFGVGGTEAAAQAGASALWGASGASTAASMGTSFAAAAGPLIALAAVDAIGRVFGGDKKLGGAEMIPVIGGFLAGLFGHGPMKFRQQSLQGTASSDGFDGDITNVFRAKGGLFVGNKHKSVSEQLSLEQQTLFDTALSGFYGSAHNFAENLGLSTDLVDNFTAQVQIKSEKGKTLTEEAITGMLKGIGNSLAQNVLPMVDTLRKAGEDSFATMTRLNNEFVALTQGAENLGASVGYAKEIIRGMTFEARTAFVDAAGGIDSLTTKTQFFADNFLTAAERLAPASQRLAESMQALGLSSDITKEQFKALVQSYGQLNGITENQLQGLLNLAPAFVAIKNAQEQLIGTTNKVAESERSLNDVRQELLSSYNKERGELESTISKFKSVSDSLRSFRDSLSLGQLSPLTPGQKLEEARAQFNRTRIAAAQGDQSALENLSGVSQEFLQASQTYNASSAAFVSDFNLVKGVLDSASQSALSQSEIARNQLTALDKSVDYLVDIQTNTKTTADLIREINIKALNGSGNAAISTKDIQGFLSANPNLTAQQIANAATKYGVSGQQLIEAGVNSDAVNLFIKGSSITDKQILDFVNSGASPQQIYDAAVANGVSSARLSAASGISKADIDKFVKDNRLPSFAKGTDFIAKSGLAMVHRAEAIVPSSTTEEIKNLREELTKLRQEQNQQTGDLIKVTDITSRQNADVIAQAMAVIDKNRQWNSRAMVRLA